MVGCYVFSTFYRHTLEQNPVQNCVCVLQCLSKLFFFIRLRVHRKLHKNVSKTFAFFLTLLHQFSLIMAICNLWVKWTVVTRKKDILSIWLNSDLTVNDAHRLQHMNKCMNDDQLLFALYMSVRNQFTNQVSQHPWLFRFNTKERKGEPFAQRLGYQAVLVLEQNYCGAISQNWTGSLGLPLFFASHLIRKFYTAKYRIPNKKHS